eukprot:775991-Prymnesium_polylepis.1
MLRAAGSGRTPAALGGSSPIGRRSRIRRWQQWHHPRLRRWSPRTTPPPPLPRRSSSGPTRRRRGAEMCRCTSLRRGLRAFF